MASMSRVLLRRGTTAHIGGYTRRNLGSHVTLRAEQGQSKSMTSTLKAFMAAAGGHTDIWSDAWCGNRVIHRKETEEEPIFFWGGDGWVGFR